MKQKPGRPALVMGQRRVTTGVSLSREQFEKYRRLGGSRFLQKLLEALPEDRTIPNATTVPNATQYLNGTRTVLNATPTPYVDKTLSSPKRDPSPLERL